MNTADLSNLNLKNDTVSVDKIVKRTMEIEDKSVLPLNNWILRHQESTENFGFHKSGMIKLIPRTRPNEKYPIFKSPLLKDCS